MNERCQKCGAELYAGQQFCRTCGTPAGPKMGAGEDAPTRMLLPDAPTTGVAANATSPLPGRSTDPVGGQPPPGYQQPPYPQHFATSPPLAPSASRPTWMIGLIIGLVCFSLLLTWGFVKSLFGGEPTVIVKKTGRHDAPTAPTAPTAPEMPGVPGAPGVSGEILDDEGASVTGQETVITKSFALDDDSTFSLKNVDGDVSVEGWDEERAEVKIIKRGGNADQRRAAHVVLANTGEQIHLVTAATPGGPVEVRYELKLPRDLRELHIAAAKSEVRAARFGGSLVVDVERGSIELEDVTGETRTNIIKGHTKINFKDAAHDGAQQFTTVSGNVEVRFAEGADADLKAETVTGEIEADPALGLRVEKRFAGQNATGRLGDGGDPVLIKVVNGNIKIRK